MVSHDEHEDIDFEPEDELGSVGAAKAKMQKLKDELERTKQERQEYLDGWQRAKADMANTKKDAAAAAERATLRAKEQILEDFLPALDSLNMAYASAAYQSLSPDWRTGMDQVKAQFLDALKRCGVERFGAEGESYDPHVHDVVQEIESEGGAPGSILKVLRFGYRAGERVLRPAQVVIRKHE